MSEKKRDNEKERVGESESTRRKEIMTASVCVLETEYERESER